MSETLNFTKLADAPVLDEVPNGAKVYAEVDGKVYRVAGDNLGGGVPTAILKAVFNVEAEVSVQSLLSGGAATVSAGDNARFSSTALTVTCDNMTYEEALSILQAGGQVLARLSMLDDQGGALAAESYETAMSYAGDGQAYILFAFQSYLFDSGFTGLWAWAPDGSISKE